MTYTKMALNAMQDAFLILDKKLRFVRANPVFFEIFPQAVEITRRHSMNCIETWPKELRSLSRQSDKNEDIEFTLSYGRKIRHFSASVDLITTPRGKFMGWVVVIRDITGAVALKNNLKSIADTDSLTGVFNRRHFMKVAEQAFEKVKRGGRPHSIIIFDLDHFKKINDTYSHKAGDVVLKSIAANVQKILRPYDILARYGGEEFIVLADMGENAAMQLALRMKNEISNGIYNFDGVSIRCTASFGVAAIVDDTLEMTIHNADLALYKAKENGRNRVEAYAENEMLSKILQDIESGFKGFVPHYQPIFSARSAKCDGAEVLMRWRSPKGELVMPDVFIPILEKLGHMSKVESWVLNQACVQCKKWATLFNNPDFYVHVNLSLDMLISGSIYKEVTAAIEYSGIEPNNLVLEFKDVFQLGEFEKEISVLNKLRQRNIRIAIDSFGSGSSPLTDFKNIPVDEIRIGRAFVEDIEYDLSSQKLLTGMIRMIKSVEYRVCVVGVETYKQKDFLQEQGIDTLQGYLWGKPVDSRKFEEQHMTVCYMNRQDLLKRVKSVM